MTEFVVGENGVLSWSSPVPPNGVILYYNVIITSGQLVTRIVELDVLTIDVSSYGEINMDYNVTVSFILLPTIRPVYPMAHSQHCYGVLTCACEQYTTSEKQSIL